ncbi:hypothetical protein IH824_10680 [candidate division KSB1 bacterium]|nr:hypothetical protein [candidate division KSB1 bacterium]
MAKKQILAELRKFDRSVEVELLSEDKVVARVENEVIPRLIGKKGATIKELEDYLGISIEVSPKIKTLGKEADFEKRFILHR